MKLQKIDGEKAWAIIAWHILQSGEFNSVTDKNYAARLSNDCIYYTGKDRSGGDEETITRKEFVEAFDSIINLDVINTNTILDIVPRSIYMQRTPFVGLLKSSGIIK